jgi:hypothetical protein
MLELEQIYLSFGLSVWAMMDNIPSQFILKKVELTNTNEIIINDYFKQDELFETKDQLIKSMESEPACTHEFYQLGNIMAPDDGLTPIFKCASCGICCVGEVCHA